ncbi:MAG: hypothetical protein QOF15_1241, partial [Mycobacterium sp.]|nr:hypothetical protein [Mycobacterium sp.]
QGDFEVSRIIVTGTYDGDRFGDTGFGEFSFDPGAREFGTDQFGNIGARSFQLFDDRRCERVVAADDDALPRVIRFLGEVLIPIDNCNTRTRPT